MKSQNFPSRPNLLPTRPSASNSPKTATTIDCRSPIGSETAFPTSWWIAAKSTSSSARLAWAAQPRDLDAAGLLMTSSSATSAGLELRISIRPKSRIHSNLVADVANNGQIVRNEQIGEAQFLLAGEHRYCGYSREDEASAAMLYYQLCGPRQLKALTQSNQVKDYSRAKDRIAKKRSILNSSIPRCNLTSAT